MSDLKGKKIGLSKSMNQIKDDWWRIQEHQGIELMLRMNDMTMDDIELVEFPYADDWYNDPKMVGPEMELSIDLWLNATTSTILPSVRWKAHWKKESSTQCIRRPSRSSSSPRMTGKFAAIEDLSRYPDSAPPGGQHSRRHHLHQGHGRQAPRTRRHLHEGHDPGRSLGQ